MVLKASPFCPSTGACLIGTVSCCVCVCVMWVREYLLFVRSRDREKEREGGRGRERERGERERETERERQTDRQRRRVWERQSVLGVEGPVNRTGSPQDESHSQFLHTSQTHKPSNRK